MGHTQESEGTKIYFVPNDYILVRNHKGKYDITIFNQGQAKKKQRIYQKS